jgi:hypothetical protein
MKLRARQFEMPPMATCYANGERVFSPDLADADWQKLAHAAENIKQAADDGKVSLVPADAAKPASITYEMPSPYLLTGGSAVVVGEGVKAYASNDNGGSWTELPGLSLEAGVTNFVLDSAINGYFGALVRFDLAKGGRIDGLKINVFNMNNPFVLPALKLGENEVTLRAGEQLEQITVLSEFDDGKYRKQIHSEKNIQTAREGEQKGWVRGIVAKDPAAESELIYRFETPGDIKRLTMGGRVHGDDNERVKYFWSTDGKKWHELKWTFRQAVKKSANTRRGLLPDLETTEDLPTGTREVFVKFWFAARGEPQPDGYYLHLANALRIDVHHEPADKRPVPPVEVTYQWTEHHGDKAVDKTLTKVAKSFPASFEVTVAGDAEPTMKSVTLRLAEGE